MIFLDESGFSLSPIRGTTWCEVGEPIVLRKRFSRQSQTGFGFITMTPIQRRLNFRFTIFSGAINTEDVICLLTTIHRHYGGKVMMIFDRLTSHISARNYFERVHPDWFVFAAEYRSNELPSYSPELNSVEQCWQMMKNVFMENFVPLSVEHLEKKAFEAASILNNAPMLLASFFHHAKLAL